MYQVNRLKGNGFKTECLTYAMDRFAVDKNISMVISLDSNEVIVQRVKDKEKLNSQQGSWKAIQNS
jgi:hypothetical protein